MSSRSRKDNSKILVNVYYPGKWILRVHVLATANCLDINKFINNYSVNLLHNGVVLEKRHSFKFYGLKNEDVLIVVSKDDRNPLKPIFEPMLLEDDEAFRSKIAYALNPKMANETGRIRDLQLTKIESKPAIYRRLVSLFESEQDTPSTQNVI